MLPTRRRVFALVFFVFFFYGASARMSNLWTGLQDSGLIHTGRVMRREANGTCCHQCECSHCMQATSKEKRSNLRAHRVALPVWIRPLLPSARYCCLGGDFLGNNLSKRNLRWDSVRFFRHTGKISLNCPSRETQSMWIVTTNPSWAAREKKTNPVVGLPRKFYIIKGSSEWASILFCGFVCRIESYLKALAQVISCQCRPAVLINVFRFCNISQPNFTDFCEWFFFSWRMSKLVTAKWSLFQNG